MRIICLYTLLVLALPLRAETWECKAPIEQIPWSAIELIAVAGEAGRASIQIGDKTYDATYQIDGSMNTWLLDPSASDELNGGKLIIDSKGNGTMRRELMKNGVIIHTDETYLCRKAKAAAE